MKIRAALVEKYRLMKRLEVESRSALIQLRKQEAGLHYLEAQIYQSQLDKTPVSTLLMKRTRALVQARRLEAHAREMACNAAQSPLLRFLDRDASCFCMSLRRHLHLDHNC